MYTISDAEFEKLRSYIKGSFGVNLGSEKKSLVHSRLSGILASLGLESFSEYYKYIVNDKTGEATRILIDKITTNHTYFMRESEHFNYLQKEVFPYLEKKYKDSKDIYLWCAGCSSGEESYTLAILLSEYFGSKGYDIKMLATDISTKVLKIAKAGIYSTHSLKDMPEAWKKKYFKKYDEENHIVSDFLKEQIIFRRLNLMDEKFPLKKPVHVIFCRNVMIYFDAKTRDNLVNKFYNQTAEGGYLFIGHSESLNHTNSKYKYIMPAVYRK